jgi:hypothetical protein
LKPTRFFDTLDVAPKRGPTIKMMDHCGRDLQKLQTPSEVLFEGFKLMWPSEPEHRENRVHMLNRFLTCRVVLVESSGDRSKCALTFLVSASTVKTGVSKEGMTASVFERAPPEN